MRVSLNHSSTQVIATKHVMTRLAKKFYDHAESQLAVRGRAVTGGSTPKATLFERALFRTSIASSLSTEI